MTNDRFHPNDPQPPTRPEDDRQPAGGRGSTAATTDPVVRDLPFVSNDDLLRFVDGVLDDDGRVRVLTRLAGRPAAVEQVEAYLDQNARLRSLREHLPLADSADFAAPLQAALVTSLRRRHTRRRWQRWGAAAALALAVAGGTIGLALEPWRATSSGPTASAVPQAFFLFDKPELASLVPAEAATEPAADHAAFDWLAGKLSDFSLQAPDFAQVGLELVAGETLERQGTPAIRLIYRDAAANPVLFHVGIGKPDADHAFWLVREGYVSLQWRRGPMVFAIVAPTDSPQLSQVVRIVGAAVARLPAPESGRTPETTPKADAAAVESGPVKAIAVPIEPAAPGKAESGETQHRPKTDPLPEAVDDNRPEPL